VSSSSPTNADPVILTVFWRPGSMLTVSTLVIFPISGLVSFVYNRMCVIDCYVIYF